MKEISMCSQRRGWQWKVSNVHGYPNSVYIAVEDTYLGNETFDIGDRDDALALAEAILRYLKETQ